jgi:hypothetical protein
MGRTVKKDEAVNRGGEGIRKGESQGFSFR